MKMRNATLALAAFLTLLALPFAAQAQRGPGVSPADILGNPRALARYLKLTPDQIKTTQQLFADLHKAVEPLRQNGKTLHDAFEAALAATPQVPCNIGDAAVAVYNNNQRIKAAFQDFDTKFSAILTPEQLARYEALKALVGDRGDS